MHSQHADAVPLRGRVADNFNIAPIKPVDKHLERGMRVAFECQRGVEQFINGIARLRAQTPEQLSPSIERAGENMLQITIRRGEIGLPQQSIKRREPISLAKRAAEMTPEGHAIPARRPVFQIVPRTPYQRGYEKVGKGQDRGKRAEKGRS